MAYSEPGGPLLARRRPNGPGRACLLCPGSSDVNLFRYGQGIVDLGCQGTGRLSLPKSRFERTDDVGRQGSDAQQRLRTARSGVCRVRPSRAKHAFAPIGGEAPTRVILVAWVLDFAKRSGSQSGAVACRRV
jgi:hypothetical protein